MLDRPAPGEYADFYAEYITLVPAAGDLVDHLEAQGSETEALLAPLRADQAEHRYAPGKWSVKEVVGHLTDSERVFAARALAFGRGDTTPLPRFDQDAYVAGGSFATLSLTAVAAEFAAVRRATVLLFRNLDDEAWLRRGVANGVEFSVRAVAAIVAGHTQHHLGVLRERYL